eukprot:Gb_12214 [translate_table: standard]
MMRKFLLSYEDMKSPKVVVKALKRRYNLPHRGENEPNFFGLYADGYHVITYFGNDTVIMYGAPLCMAFSGVSEGNGFGEVREVGNAVASTIKLQAKNMVQPRETERRMWCSREKPFGISREECGATDRNP